MKQDMENRKPKVAFVCVHNSCRSQMAEALGKAIAADTFISCSARYGNTKSDQSGCIASDETKIQDRYGTDTASEAS